jgi:hypothetical protein
VVAAQLGAQVSLQSSQRWLILVDGHYGIEKVDSVNSADEPVTLPTLQSLSAYLRLQYRFR